MLEIRNFTFKTKFI